MIERGHQLRDLKILAVPQLSALDQIQEYVQERLYAPVTLVPDLAQDSLDRLWLEFVASRHEVDGEASECMAGDDDFERCLPAVVAHWDLEPEEWHSMAINCGEWYEKAVGTFLKEFLGPCLLAPFVTEAERAKHFPIVSDRTSIDLKNRSRKGESLFAFGIDSTALGEFTRSVEADVLDHLLGVNNLRVFVECLCTIGYTDGEPTQIIAVEWASGGVHCYPAAQRDVQRANASNDLVYDDILQGMAKTRRS